jgi:serine/threonine protein kinase
MLFNLITGRYLFKGSNRFDLLQKNYECNLSTVRPYLEAAAGENLIDLNLRMLQVDPKLRPTAKEALQHPFFK